MKEVKLPEALKTKLETIGDTPLKEPEIYAMMLEGKRPTEIFKAIAKDDDINKYKAEEIADFIKKVNKKIAEVQYPSGDYKKTPATENCDLPNFSECEEYYYLVVDGMKEGLSKEEKEKNLDKRQELIWKIAKLDKNSMSDWEQGLVEAQISMFCIRQTQTALGLDIKN